MEEYIEIYKYIYFKTCVWQNIAPVKGKKGTHNIESYKHNKDIKTICTSLHRYCSYIEQSTLSNLILKGFKHKSQKGVNSV